MPVSLENLSDSQLCAALNSIDTRDPAENAGEQRIGTVPLREGGPEDDKPEIDAQKRKARKS